MSTLPTQQNRDLSAIDPAVVCVIRKNPPGNMGHRSVVDLTGQPIEKKPIDINQLCKFGIGCCRRNCRFVHPVGWISARAARRATVAKQTSKGLQTTPPPLARNSSKASSIGERIRRDIDNLLN